MSFNWKKGGFIFAADGKASWARSHAIFPTAEVMGSLFRIYFTGMDENNFGRIGFVDVDPKNSCRVVNVSKEPVLDLGEIGTFDDSGVNAFSILTVQEKKYLYYQGWQRTHRAPYCIFTGLATSSANALTFTKVSKAPVLDRINSDAKMRAAPFVMHDKGVFRMWYCSVTSWEKKGDHLDYRISMAYTESPDGVHWHQEPRILFGPTGQDYATGRPTVVKISGKYHMWYSIRSFAEPYRLGYAISDDGLKWNRQDERVGLEKSSSGWDSEMISYPYVIEHQQKLFMFYNGNQHGKTGFGFASCDL